MDRSDELQAIWTELEEEKNDLKDELAAVINKVDRFFDRVKRRVTSVCKSGQVAIPADGQRIFSNLLGGSSALLNVANHHIQSRASISQSSSQTSANNNNNTTTLQDITIRAEDVKLEDTSDTSSVVEVDCSNSSNVHPNGAASSRQSSTSTATPSVSVPVETPVVKQPNESSTVIAAASTTNENSITTVQFVLPTDKSPQTIAQPINNQHLSTDEEELSKLRREHLHVHRHHSDYYYCDCIDCDEAMRKDEMDYDEEEDDVDRQSVQVNPSIAPASTSFSQLSNAALNGPNCSFLSVVAVGAASSQLSSQSTSPLTCKNEIINETLIGDSGDAGHNLQDNELYDGQEISNEVLNELMLPSTSTGRRSSARIAANQLLEWIYETTGEEEAAAAEDNRQGPSLNNPNQVPSVVTKTAKRKSPPICSASKRSKNEVTNNNESSKLVKVCSLNCTVSHCKVKVSSGEQLNHHLNTKHGLATFRCFVSKCKSRFSDWSQFEGHFRDRHSDAENVKYECFVCHREYISQKQAYSHWYRLHLSGQFACNAGNGCEFEANTRQKIYNHQRVQHRDLPSYAGQAVPPNRNRSLSASRLPNIVRPSLNPAPSTLATPTTKFECTHPGCTAWFGRSCDLGKHRRVHLPKRFECTFGDCTHQSMKENLMMDHVRVHHFKPLKEEEDLRDPKDYFRELTNE